MEDLHGAARTPLPIAANKAPGGLVFQTWADGEMVKERAITEPGAATAAKGETDGGLALRLLQNNRRVEMRVYDGDTGKLLFFTALRGERP